MIPYFGWTTWHLGPIPIQVWGSLVALGVLAGTSAAAWLATKRGLRAEIIWDKCAWVIFGALLGARLFHVLFYVPQYYWEHPFETLAIWHGGLSIMGGFLGAAVAGIVYLEKHQVNIFEYADVSVFGLPLGEAIGRLGCFFIHDHPGMPTNFFLGVRYPDGIVRHDHGLYLSINGLVLFLIFCWLLKKKVHPGTFIIVFLVWNGVARFILDFWRASEGSVIDARYFGLTPAQYAGGVMVGVGIYLWRHKFFERGRQAWREFKWL